MSQIPRGWLLRCTNLGVPTPGWRYGSRARKPGARSWSVATVSNIVRQRAYSGTHEVRINGGEELIEQAVPAVVDATLQERAKVALTQNKRYPHRKGYRRYLLSGLAKCAACGAAYSGHTSTKRGKKYHYYTCHASRTNNLGTGRSHKPPYVNAGWLEQLVWADLRRFMANPGEILKRVREQLDTGDNTEELEARRADLAKRLTARHVEKDRYVRLYAQGHLSEDELDAYLAGLKNQTENIRLLLESVEDELSRGRDQAELTETAHA